MTARVHPSVFIINWLARHGLRLDHLAAAITDKCAADPQRECGVNLLALECYVAIGPTDPAVRLHDMAEQLDEAMKLRRGFLAKLEREWLEGGCSSEGLPS